MLLALTLRQWRALIEVLGIGVAVAKVEGKRGVSLARDEGLRFVHRDALFPLVEAAVAGRELAELGQALDAGGGCWGPYQTMAEAVGDPTLIGNNPLFGTSPNPSGQDYPAAGAFATIPQLECVAPQPAPELGADSAPLLAELLGLKPDELAELRSQGLIA